MGIRLGRGKYQHWGQLGMVLVCPGRSEIWDWRWRREKRRREERKRRGGRDAFLSHRWEACLTKTERGSHIGWGRRAFPWRAEPHDTDAYWLHFPTHEREFWVRNTRRTFEGHWRGSGCVRSAKRWGRGVLQSAAGVLSALLLIGVAPSVRLRVCITCAFPLAAACHRLVLVHSGRLLRIDATANPWSVSQPIITRDCRLTVQAESADVRQILSDSVVWPWQALRQEHCLCLQRPDGGDTRVKG